MISRMKSKEKGLSSFHLTMLALGTVIGGSFFLGSSVAIHAAGPSILLAFVLGGVLVYFILTALSEMTVADPGAGSFRAFAAGAFGKGAGFVVGWVYWTGMVLAMSSEATAASIFIRNWLPSLPLPLLGILIIVGVTLANLLGAKRLSRLESGLAAVKLFAVVSFIVLAALLILGLAGAPPVGTGALADQPFMPGGFGGFMGSMLIVMFSYAGFEIIGLAACEACDPRHTVPRAIRNTVIWLVALYVVSIGVLLPLVPTTAVSGDTSPFVSGLNAHGIGWAGAAINVVLISAILSTMLAAMFGLGRMMRSLADERMAPKWLREQAEVPRRGILFSGLSMLAGLGVGLLFPAVYLFLISSGGFALLFTYAVIMATHVRFRKKHGCPPDGQCQLRGYPYTTVVILIALVLAIAGMPLVPGQLSGLLAGGVLVAFFALCYLVIKSQRQKNAPGLRQYRSGLSAEASKELDDFDGPK